MADVYGVLPSDIAAELPGLFPAGFTATSLPSEAQVASLITTADTIVNLRIIGVQTLAEDAGAVIAIRYITEWVKAAVIRIAYAGRDPVQIAAAAQPYSDLAKLMLEQLVIVEVGSTWGSAAVVRSS